MSNLASVTETEKRIGRIIRGLRLSRELSQEELARLTDLSTSTIANIEHARGASLTTFIRVLRALDRLDIVDVLDEGYDDQQLSPMEMLRALKKKEVARRQRAPRQVKD